jgi:hypothetical protein
MPFVAASLSVSWSPSPKGCSGGDGLVSDPWDGAGRAEARMSQRRGRCAPQSACNLFYIHINRIKKSQLFFAAPKKALCS